jgi:Tol biopolymer transport system component
VGVAGGYLISLNKGVLVAQPYDPDRAAVTGAPVEIANGIMSDPPQRSGAPFSAGAGNVIAYRSASPNSRLIWFDRAGRQLDELPGTGDYHHPKLSPDEKSLLVEKTDPSTGRHTIWALDLLRGTTSRLIYDPFGAHQPVWSPDGRRIAFSSNRLGGLTTYMTSSDGSGTLEPVLPAEKTFANVADWSRDGRHLLYWVHSAGHMGDLEILPLGPRRAPVMFLVSAANETQGQFSPDGAWVTYTSDESGAPEVYARHFPDTGAKWQISTHGGAQGRWRGDGKELFYLALDGRLMAVDIKASPSSFEAGEPRPLFNTGIAGSFVDRFNQYLVTRDGQRVLVNRSAEDENSAPITIVMNWDTAPQR